MRACEIQSGIPFLGFRSIYQITHHEAGGRVNGGGGGGAGAPLLLPSIQNYYCYYHHYYFDQKGEAPGRRTGGVRGGGSPLASTFHHFLGTENPLCWDTTRPDFFWLGGWEKKIFLVGWVGGFSLPPFSKLTLKLTLILTLSF